MKKVFRITVFALLISCFALSVFAQKEKSKDDYMKEISALFKVNKPEEIEKAFYLAKEFLVKFPKEKGENIDKLKKFVTQNREPMLFTNLERGKIAEGFAAGKELLAEKSDNSVITMNLAYAGFDTFSKTKDRTFADQSIDYAKQTLKLFEEGKIPTNFSPFKDKNDASAWMYYIIANFLKEKDIREAAINFYQATRFDSQIKSSSYPYYIVSAYYEEVYQKMANDYNAKLKTFTDEQNKTELDKINKIIDLMLDAYARTIKFAEAENSPEKTNWRQRFTDVYKFRNKTDAGLNEFMTLKNASPMPDPSAN